MFLVVSNFIVSWSTSLYALLFCITMLSLINVRYYRWSFFVFMPIKIVHHAYVRLQFIVISFVHHYYVFSVSV